MRVAINRCYGGFGLSHAAVMRYAELIGLTLYPFMSWLEGGKIMCRPYVAGDDDPQYATRPLNEDRSYTNGSYWEFDTLSASMRHDPALLQVIDELGDKVNGRNALIKVVEIPDLVLYTISDSNGFEAIHEVHRTWA